MMKREQSVIMCNQSKVEEWRHTCVLLPSTNSWWAKPVIKLSGPRDSRNPRSPVRWRFHFLTWLIRFWWSCPWRIWGHENLSVVLAAAISNVYAEWTPYLVQGK